MKAKRQFNTGAAASVKPFRRANGSLAQAGEVTTFNHQRQTSGFGAYL